MPGTRSTFGAGPMIDSRPPIRLACLRTSDHDEHGRVEKGHVGQVECRELGPSSATLIAGGSPSTDARSSSAVTSTARRSCAALRRSCC